MDRHAALAMTEERWLCSVLSPRAPDDNNLLYSVTARRLHADVVVKTLTVMSVWVMDRYAALAMTEERRVGKWIDRHSALAMTESN